MLTEAQRLERKRHLGGSDISAIFGIDSFHNELDIYYSKVYDVINKKITEAMQKGIDNEEDICKWVGACYDTGIDLTPERLQFICPHNNIFMCHVDALALDLPTHIEAKFTHSFKDWGHQGSIEIPEAFYLQVQTQLLCRPEIEYVLVGVYIESNPIERRHYKILRNVPIIQKIEKFGSFWWNKYVIPKIKPPDSPLPSIETLKSIKRNENIVALPPEATQVYLKYVDVKREYDEQKEVMKPLEKELDAWERALISYLGDNTAGNIGEGIVVRYDKITRCGFTVKESSYRKLKIERRGI